MTEKRVSRIENNIITPRKDQDGPIFDVQEDGSVIVNLVGYEIRPIREEKDDD
jgi:hypothetical protein